MQFFQILGILKLVLPLEDSRCGSDDKSGSETGWGDEEVLGLEAAADAGGLTSFSRKKDRREETKQRRKPIRQGSSDIQMPWESGLRSVCFTVLWWEKKWSRTQQILVKTLSSLGTNFEYKYILMAEYAKKPKIRDKTSTNWLPWYTFLTFFSFLI